MTLTSDSPASVVAARSLALALGQGGGGLGAFDQGSSILITGSGFGTKPQAAPVLWDSGLDVFENGVKSTYRQGLMDGSLITDTISEPDELYDGLNAPKLVTTSRPQRYAGALGHYIGSTEDGTVSIGKPKAAGGDAPGVHSKHYQAWWIRYGYHFQKMHSFQYSALSGQFQTPDLSSDPEAIGEQVTLSNGETAYVIRLTDTRICVYTPNSTARMNELAGTSIIGQSSGATLTVVDDGIYTDDHSGSEKVARIWNGDGVTLGNFRYTWNRTQSATVGTGQAAENTGDINDPSMAGEGAWALLETIIDLENNILSVFANGNRTDLDLTAYQYATDKGLYIAHIGWQAVRTLYNVVEFGEVYLDHTHSRVYLGNSPTWGACTHRELQRPISWSDGQVVVNKKFGLLSGDKYVYVVTNFWPNDATEGVLLEPAT